MAANFPTSLPAIARVLPTDYMNDPGKEADLLHNEIADEIEALATFVGVSGSVVPGSVEARLNAALPATKTAARTLLSAGGLSSGNDAAPKFLLNDTDYIDSSAQSLVVTCGLSSMPSKIGSPTRPVGSAGSISSPSAPVDADRGVPWADDSGYVAGEADVSTIIGGYDHINNQIAGTIIGGGHHFIPYNVGGHSTIIGGSNSNCSGNYAVIAGGTQNTIINGTNAKCAAIVGGEKSLVSSDFSGTLGGYNSQIFSGTSYSAIVGGRDCKIQGAASYAAICGGNSNTAEGQYSGIFAGYNHTLLGASTASVIVGGSASAIASTATHSAIIAGKTNSVANGHNFSVLIGQDAKSEAAGGLTIGRAKLVNAGDCQASTLVWGQRTTTASLETMVMNDNAQWNISSPGMACVINAIIIGVDQSNNNMAAYSYTGSAKWTGSNGEAADSGGTGATRNFTQIVDQIGVAGLPLISVSSGSIRPRIYGKAATNIKWTCKMDIATVRV